MTNVYGERKRKRKRRTNKEDKRKLLPGEKVEVLYTDEGLNGSWHTGTVIAFGERSRLVEYAYLLNEDNSSKLKESIPVSAAIEGRAKRLPRNHRGQIRPVPPCYEIQESELKYGLCVDALVDDALWEGVIFDQEESSKERLIFFPDQGDQQKISVDRLRLTQEWNAVSGNWKPRGEWLLLQVIQPFEQEDVLPVSIREIWYDLRTMAAFSDRIGLWTCGSHDIWHSLVSELIQELQSVACGLLPADQLNDFSMTCDAIGFPVENFPCLDGTDLSKDCAVVNTVLPAAENNFLCSNLFALDVHSQPGSLLQQKCPKANCLEVVTEKSVAGASSTGVYGKEAQWLSGLDEVNTDLICHDNNAEPNSNLARRGDSTGINKKHRSSKDWIPIDLEAAYYPEAIKVCAYHSEDGTHHMKELVESDDNLATVRLKAKKHLLALDWKIEARPRNTKSVRIRFVSPEGKCYASLHTACRGLLNGYEEKDQKCRNEGAYDQQDCPVKRSKHQGEECNLAVELFSTSKDANLTRSDKGMYGALVKAADFGITDETSSNTFRKDCHIFDASEMAQSAYDDLQPRCLPDAILEYKNYVDSCRGKTKQDFSFRDVSSIRLDARKHLKFMDWKFWKVKPRGDILITSPSGKPFRSLYSACEGYSREENLSALVLPDGANSGCTNLSEQGLRLLHLTACREAKANESKKLLGKGLPLKQPPAHSSVCEKSRKSKAGLARRGHGHNISGRVSSRVVRSSLRSQEMVETDSQHARTVLSLLIDNDMVLPRQKVQYVRKRDGHVLKEGRVTRDGIRCKCCKLVYTLSNFEAHAGSTIHRPAANIFLQDGRSLLDCQMQMIHHNKPQDFHRSRVKSDYSLYKSDGICSVCHDGGSLILCDHCPSAFHIECVGLQAVPEGEWPCPSCRCSICGLGEFNPDTLQFTDKTVLYCDQCEHEFHVGCMRKRERARLSRFPIGNWFCSKKCSKIFLHLRKLIGKSRPTAVKGLSITILRSDRETSVNGQPFDAETMAEHDSKLRVALNVLHECFVTIIEPRTCSDFVADLIFNKESELRRLNFYGFYTMLLERGDELISVANFRVYGEKVAEMPLIGTRMKYRRQGMCRLLVDELEKLLSALGVERLLLPAVPQLLQTWTTSFGFTAMSHSDRLYLSEYSLLNFQDTTMCQKSLGTTVAKAKGYCTKLVNTSSKSVEKINSDTFSIISELVETAEPIKVLPLLGAETCNLPGEADHLQISSHTDAAYSPVSNCVDPVEQRLLDTRVNDKSQLNDSQGKCCNSSVSIEMSPTVVVNSSANTNFKLLRFYNRISKRGGSRGGLLKSITNQAANTFKYFYRRRISANRRLPGNSK